MGPWGRGCNLGWETRVLAGPPSLCGHKALRQGQGRGEVLSVSSIPYFTNIWLWPRASVEGIPPSTEVSVPPGDEAAHYLVKEEP